MHKLFCPKATNRILKTFGATQLWRLKSSQFYKQGQNCPKTQKTITSVKSKFLLLLKSVMYDRWHCMSATCTSLEMSAWCSLLNDAKLLPDDHQSDEFKFSSWTLRDTWWLIAGQVWPAGRSLFTTDPGVQTGLAKLNYFLGWYTSLLDKWVTWPYRVPTTLFILNSRTFPGPSRYFPDCSCNPTTYKFYRETGAANNRAL